MAAPSVSSDAQNQGQGATKEIERKVLFIGVGTGTALGVVNVLNSVTDLDDLLGAGDSELKANIAASVIEAGSGFEGACIEIANFAEWPAALAMAMQTFSPEIVAVCTPIAASQDLTDAQATAQLMIATYQRLVRVVMATPGILGAQSWSEYIATQTALTDGVVGARVLAVSNLHGNNVGCCVGRMADKSVSIADSIIRTQTGAVVALGPAPVDTNGKKLELDTLGALHGKRLTVPYWFEDYDGVYWTDAVTLDAEGGDFQLAQNGRVSDKAQRAIRILSIQQIGNRQFNDSEVSKKFYASYFAKPLRVMAQTVKVGDIEFPGEIKPIAEDAVTIQWVSNSKVKIYYKLTPYESPTEIENYLMLDLSE